MAPANRDHAFDLHVLSMPPAFVLSQDQTLMFNPDKPAILSDDRPVVQGPAPAQKTGPNKGHQTLCARYPPPNTLSGPDQSVPRARDRQPLPPPAHPFIHQQCQSAIPHRQAPLQDHSPRRPAAAGGRLYGPLPHTVKPLSKPHPNTPIPPPHSKPNPRNSPSNHPGNPFPPRASPPSPPA